FSLLKVSAARTLNSNFSKRYHYCLNPKYEYQDLVLIAGRREVAFRALEITCQTIRIISLRGDGYGFIRSQNGSHCSRHPERLRRPNQQPLRTRGRQGS